jgi:hypothetical protein
MGRRSLRRRGLGSLSRYRRDGRLRGLLVHALSARAFGFEDFDPWFGHIIGHKPL